MPSQHPHHPPQIRLGWEETYVISRIGPCEIFLDPRIEDSVNVRADIAARLNVPRGRVRVHACGRMKTQGDTTIADDIARLEVVVARSFYDTVDDTFATRRRINKEVQNVSTSSLTLLRVGPDSADPSGTWFAGERKRALSLAAEDLLVRSENVTMTSLGLVAIHAADTIAVKDQLKVATSQLAVDFSSEGVTEGRVVQTEMISQADELANIVTQKQNLFSSESSEGDAFVMLGNKTFEVQKRSDEFVAALKTASDLINHVNVASLNSPDDALAPTTTTCRGANGARLSFYDVISQSGVREGKLLHRRFLKSASTLEPSASSEMLMVHHGKIHKSRKLLRISTNKKNSVAQSSGKDSRIVAKAGQDGFDESWSGYEKVDPASYDDDKRVLQYTSYTRPRTLGATKQLRIVGGVLVTQNRVSLDAGCRGRRASAWTKESAMGSSRWRFSDLYSSIECANRLVVGGAYGYDSMFARLDLPRGVHDNDVTGGRYPGGLYKPVFRSIRHAFYNASEIAAPDIPFAFYERHYDGKKGIRSADVENALFDVYLDGTLMENRARLLLSYLYHSRFVDRRTKSIDIRVLLHHEQMQVLVDTRVHMEINEQGNIQSSTKTWKIPLIDYFDTSSPQSVLLFVVDVLIAVLAVVLCVSLVGDARRFAHLLHEAIVRRLQQRIVRRHFLVDMWALAVEAVQLAIPICLLAASVVHFVYFFAYVRTFTYERNYRWYDGDGSAAARILLPKRLADPQPPVEGYPRGAWRHTLPADLTERDAYLALLDKVDVMSTLNGWYLVLQVPIILGIATNIVRHFFRLPYMYPYMRTMQRSLPGIANLAGFIIFSTVLSSYAFYLLLGDRVEKYSRANHSIQNLAEYQVGDSSGLRLRTLSGRQEGSIVTPTEFSALIFIRFAYPILTSFILMQFSVAILLDFFTAERVRRSALKDVKMRHESPDHALARLCMRASGHLDYGRDTISGLLYCIGWKNVAAAVFTGNSKWLNPNRGIRGFTTNDVVFSSQQKTGRYDEPSTDSGSEEDGMDDVDSHPYDYNTNPLSRWQRTIQMIMVINRAQALLEDIVKRVDDRVEEERKSKKTVSDVSWADNLNPANRVYNALEPQPSLIAGDVRQRGLRSDTSRFLRMNQADRQEIAVPVLGQIGPTALGELLYEVHQLMLGFRASDTKVAQDGNVQIMLGNSPSSPFVNIEFDQTPRPRRVKRRREIEGIIYQFATRSDQERLLSRTDHLQDAKYRMVLRNICTRIANRMVHDVGARAGSEFDHFTGVALSQSVLRRARDTAKCMCAVTADMLALNEPILQVTTTSSDILSTPDMQASRRRTSFANMLFSFSGTGLNSRRRRRDVVDGVWTLGVGVVGIVSEIPWKMAGMMFNMCRGKLPFSRHNADNFDSNIMQGGSASLWDETDGISAIIRQPSSSRGAFSFLGGKRKQKREQVRDILTGGY